MFGVKDSPTFNVKDFPRGRALAIKSNDRNEWYGFSHAVLVVNCTPLELTVVYVEAKESGDHIISKTAILPIDLVARETLEIYPMEAQILTSK